jgi:hypothetical protein
MAKLDTQEYLESLKTTKKDANKLKSGIVQYEKTASKHTKTLASWVDSSKTKFNDTVTELKSRFTKEAQTLKSTAKAETDAVEKIRKEAKDHYNQFSKTYSAAMSKRNGVETKHSKIVALTDEATTKINEISKHQTRASNAKDEIVDLLQKSRKNDKEIATIYEEAEKVNEEIKNTYAITLDTTMAGTLVDRRNALKERTELWEKFYLASIIAIVSAILIALLVSKPDNFTSVITERFVFVTPLVIIAFVLGKQYGHERKLYEEYAFKAAAAQSLRGYTVLLNSEFKNIEEARLDILRFTIGAMEGIYDREPIIQNPSTVHLMFGNKLAKFEAKLEENVQKATNEAVKAALKEAGIDKQATTTSTAATISAT